MKTQTLLQRPALILVALLAPALLGSGIAHAQSVVKASAGSSLGLSLVTGSLVGGTLSAMGGTSEMLVTAVEKTGDSVVLVLKGASEGVTASVKVAASAVGGTSLAVGSAIKVVAEASGYALYYSGKLIAFLPNEIGKSLTHHEAITHNGEAK